MNTWKGSMAVSNSQVLSGERSKMRVEWRLRSTERNRGQRITEEGRRYKSPGSRPVRLPIRASILGPISTAS